MLGLGGSSSRIIRKHLVNAADRKRLRSNGCFAGQQLVQQHAQVNKCPFAYQHRADSAVPAPGSCTPACRRSDRTRVQRLFGQRLVRGLGDAEVDDLGHWLVIVHGDQNIGRLEVAMNDALLMGVLDGLADVDEQLQPLARRQLFSSQYSVMGMPLTNSITK